MNEYNIDTAVANMHVERKMIQIKSSRQNLQDASPKKLDEIGEIFSGSSNSKSSSLRNR